MSSSRKLPRYPEDLVMAVRYLWRKGYNSREIAERLGVSPFTVRTILYILRKRGLVEPRRTTSRSRRSSEEEEEV